MSKVNKVVLAYSGGLDTSIILKWLEDTYGCEVVTFTADIGQGEEIEPARAKAQALGVREIYIESLKEEFARDYVFPMFRANTIYEGEYLLGTSIARPLIAKRLVEIAAEMRGHTAMPLIIQSNAGLPRNAGGTVVYPEDPEYMAERVGRLVPAHVLADPDRGLDIGMTAIQGIDPGTPGHCKCPVAGIPGRGRKIREARVVGRIDVADRENPADR